MDGRSLFALILNGVIMDKSRLDSMEKMAFYLFWVGILLFIIFLLNIFGEKNGRMAFICSNIIIGVAAFMFMHGQEVYCAIKKLKLSSHYKLN